MIIKGGKSGHLTSCVKQSDSPNTLHTYWKGPDQINTDNSLYYYDMPKYVVRRVRRSSVKDIQSVVSSREQKPPTRYNDMIAGSSCHRGGSSKFLFRGSITVGGSSSSDVLSGLPGRGEPSSRA